MFRAEPLAQALYQPSGNGMNGHSSWLLFAAIGGCGRGGGCLASIALLTASSNRSNSTSLIALFEGAGTLDARIVILPKIIDTTFPGRIESF
jgi:hypothetical protein